MSDLSKICRSTADHHEVHPRNTAGFLSLRMELAHAKTTLRHAADALDNRWRPIAEAPRDEPLLLLPFDGQPCVCTIHEDSAGEAYVATEHGVVFDGMSIFTHFSRLPAPPEQGGE